MGSAEIKRGALYELLRSSASWVIAYSGGVDSAFLLAVASGTVGERCLGVIADSPSLPRRALTEALDLAAAIGAKVEVIATAEMQNANYISNPPNRCYFCKAELFSNLESLARARGFCSLAYGENADDAEQVRPGRQAASEFQVRAPLREVGLTKTEIRSLSRLMHLPTADAPAQPCLSSRIPHGSPVTPAALAMIERGEEIARGFGLRVFRIRHHLEGGRCRARLEVAPNEVAILPSIGDSLCEALRRVGYDEVVVDPRGYRSPVT